MLTIVGYSINATIVIFDRIRENKAVMKREDTMIEIVDQKYYTDTYKKYLYNFNNIYNGIYDFHHGCFIN